MPHGVTSVHQWLWHSAQRNPQHPALQDGPRCWSYHALCADVQACAAGLARLGLARQERVAVYLDKRAETVIALWGALAAGAAMVPVNPLLKSSQVLHVLQDCSASVLVTSAARWADLRAVQTGARTSAGAGPGPGPGPSWGASDAPVLPPGLRTLRWVLLLDDDDAPDTEADPWWPGVSVLSWRHGLMHSLTMPDAPMPPGPLLDSDVAAILYTSGSTGLPKGVVLSHRNLVLGAESVAQYLENHAGDRVLAVLPLSFDYGLSQLTTAFSVGATVVLMNYLLPRDVVRLVAQERITGLAGVPPLWFQLAPLSWPDSVREHLRYVTNSGGVLPVAVSEQLCRVLPGTRIFLMYGLTEAFRSTYLPPEQLAVRPTSIGKAIPHADVQVVRADGSRCAPGEPGELVHAGPLVSLGYWNDPERTAQRFRPAPGALSELPLPPLAVWSGDTVFADAEGYLYFVGRNDEQLKTSGYRVSPGEVEAVLYDSGQVAEALVFGVPDDALGQRLVAWVVLKPPASGTACGAEAHGESLSGLRAYCRAQLPAYLVPELHVQSQPLPRNPNGKLDRAAALAGYGQRSGATVVAARSADPGPKES